ncbi:META domain-containing protein [Streptomyces sp. NPDC001941]|uniref:META domain-containing protein n=1 Tax=Streptomyces sp. NPDC001941 TaxID=3154659 RepID=UPI00332CAAD9
MEKQRITAVTAVALLALTACGTESASGPKAGDSVAEDAPVTGLHWTVESVTAGGRRTAAPAGAHVEIDTKGGARGSYGCNHFQATAAVSGDTVTVKPGVSTQMACEQKVQDFETAFKHALTGKLTAKVTDDRLTLTTASGDAVALTAEPDAPLTGTTWTVDALTSGGTARSLPAGTEKGAHLVLGEDGSVRGSLGCNTFTATAPATGSTFAFGRLATTRKLCQGPAQELEQALLKVLDGKVAYKLDHRTLTLTGPSGQGLSATAGAAPEGAGS